MTPLQKQWGKHEWIDDYTRWGLTKAGRTAVKGKEQREDV